MDRKAETRRIIAHDKRWVHRDVLTGHNRKEVDERNAVGHRLSKPGIVPMPRIRPTV